MGSVAATASELGTDEASEYEWVIERTFLSYVPKRPPVAEAAQSATGSESSASHR